MSFKFDNNAMRKLQKDLDGQFKKVEVEANKAAARETTPQKKVQAFAKVLRKHGVDNVNEAELRRKFGA